MEKSNLGHLQPDSKIAMMCGSADKAVEARDYTMADALAIVISMVQLNRMYHVAIDVASEITEIPKDEIILRIENSISLWKKNQC